MLPGLLLGNPVRRLARHLLAPTVGSGPSQRPFTRLSRQYRLQYVHGRVNVPGLLLRGHTTLLRDSFGFQLCPSLPCRRAGDFHAENPLPRPFVALTAALPSLAPCKDLVDPFRSMRRNGPASAKPTLARCPIILCSPPPVTDKSVQLRIDAQNSLRPAGLAVP